MLSLLQDALQYAKDGFSIIPVTPNEKAPPLIDWQMYQQEAASAAQIREWWGRTPHANIAIITGQISGLTVLDFDGDKGRISFRDKLEQELPHTRVHRTPRGAHLLFQYHADLKQTAHLLPGVDVRNDGGYIIAPPSVVKGNLYQVLRPRALALIETLPPSLNHNQPAETKTANLNEAPNWVSTALSGVAIEERNNTAARLIGYFHHKGVPSDIIQATMELFGERCSPPMDKTELHRTIESVTRYRNVAQAQHITEPPLLTRDGDAYVYTWDAQQITLRLDSVYRQKDGLHARLDIETTLPDHPPHVHGPVNWGLYSTSGRNSLAAYLRKRIESIDWPSILEESARLTSGMEDAIDPVIALSALAKTDAHPILITPFLQEKEPTVLFGDGGTGKSTLALIMMLTLHTGEPVGPITPLHARRGLYLDWEASPETHRDRLEALCNGLGLLDHLPDISYMRCHMGLHDHTRQIKAALSQTGATFIVVDSAAAACAGEPEKAEVAIRFFNVLRSFDVTPLIIAHSPKESSSKKPFGSVFWHNAPRSTFEIIQQGDNPKNEINVGVYQRKANDRSLASPVGLNFVFDQDVTYVTDSDLSKYEDLAAHLPAAAQIKEVLKHGQKSLQEIYQSLPQLREDNIRKALSRRTQFVHLGSAIYGIIKEDDRLRL